MNVKVMKNSTRKMFLIAGLLGASALTPGVLTPQPAVAQSRGILNAHDRKFMKEAAQGGMTEVKLGRLISSHASSRAVRQFGQRMVTDHSKANAQLTQLARQKRVLLPAGIGAEHQATYNRMARLSGRTLDRAYVNNMVQDHKKDIAEFTEESRHGGDPAVRAFATRTLPTLRMHLNMILNIQRNLR